ncbi:MAG: hypothetical protein BWY31_04427 [Lentisphaerae bacterium ADurb.Bin242]|nr:MAG: hypothetical protein BWY31_04427 [Lentisphaerae bacterium ADurb.Bin242]
MKLNVKLNFDASKVEKAARKGCITSLRGAAAYIYKVARNSIRRRVNPDKASPPGTPPYAHSTGITDIKKSIAFKVDEKNMTAVVGPVHIKGGLGNVARLHEFGGTKETEKSKKPMAGDWDTTKAGPVAINKDNVIVFGKLRSDKQRARAWRISSMPGVRYANKKEQGLVRYRAKMRKEQAIQKKGTLNYPERPYMGPALQKSQEKIAPMWRNAIISN